VLVLAVRIFVFAKKEGRSCSRVLWSLVATPGGLLRTEFLCRLALFNKKESSSTRRGATEKERGARLGLWPRAKKGARLFPCGEAARRCGDGVGAVQAGAP
jgi:hypothetical protein